MEHEGQASKSDFSVSKGGREINTVRDSLDVPIWPAVEGHGPTVSPEPADKKTGRTPSSPWTLVTPQNQQRVRPQPPKISIPSSNRRINGFQPRALQRSATLQVLKGDFESLDGSRPSWERSKATAKRKAIEPLGGDLKRPNDGEGYGKSDAPRPLPHRVGPEDVMERDSSNSNNEHSGSTENNPVHRKLYSLLMMEGQIAAGKSNRRRRRLT